ncbi:hypothetical protein N7466_001215 [Penicillium verhagenii]|uniref:uncharacterized protein n=1 Tax=Penicillium verhagenii TaxID=1562060 RepID=UPI0025458463|nr:uncharacterized protein N7466_001215 [Penicillium verhagenii]KAJ5948200.1 hypothetical protein N7466_001215 [Penicillium verhagenii]
MGKIDYSNGVSILQLIVYFPSIFISAFLVARHGLRTNSGFIFIVVFTLLRIIGGICDLLTINNDSKSLYTTYAITSSIGLTPMLMACSGLLSRADGSIKKVTGYGLPELPTFRAFRLLNIVALILCITGITLNMNDNGTISSNIEAKIGMVLYIVSWVFMMVLLAILNTRRGGLEPLEKRTLLAVAISSPFILVRVIYAVLVWFLDDKTFSMTGGNETVTLVMSVLMEFAVVITILGIGITLPVRGKAPQNSDKERGLQQQWSGRS